MCVCSRTTRAGSTPSAATRANASAKPEFHPRSSRSRQRDYRLTAPAASPLQLQPAAQHLRHAPRLRHAAARDVGAVGVEHFRNLADAGVVEMAIEGREQVAEFL